MGGKTAHSTQFCVLIRPKRGVRAAQGNVTRPEPTQLSENISLICPSPVEDPESNESPVPRDLVIPQIYLKPVTGMNPHFRDPLQFLSVRLTRRVDFFINIGLIYLTLSGSLSFFVEHFNGAWIFPPTKMWYILLRQYNGRILASTAGGRSLESRTDKIFFRITLSLVARALYRGRASYFSLTMGGGGRSAPFLRVNRPKKKGAHSAWARSAYKAYQFFVYRKAFLLPPRIISLFLTFNNVLWMHDKRDRLRNDCDVYVLVLVHH